MSLIIEELSVVHEIIIVIYFACLLYSIKLNLLFNRRSLSSSFDLSLDQVTGRAAIRVSSILLPSEMNL